MKVRNIRQAIGLLAVAATAAGVVLSVGPSAGSPSAAAAVSAPSHIRTTPLTPGQLAEVRRLSPVQWTQLNKELSRVFADAGFRVGLGSPMPQPVSGGAMLTAYKWSGGVRWDHAWVTASYANLASAARAANRYQALYYLAGVGCGIAIPGVGGVICGEIAGGIALLAAEVSAIPAVTNHGVWAAFYWFGNYWTGGYW